MHSLIGGKEVMPNGGTNAKSRYMASCRLIAHACHIERHDMRMVCELHTTRQRLPLNFAAWHTFAAHAVMAHIKMSSLCLVTAMHTHH